MHSKYKKSQDYLTKPLNFHQIWCFSVFLGVNKPFLSHPDQTLLAASYGRRKINEKKSTLKHLSSPDFINVVMIILFQQSGFTTVGRPGMACKQYNSPLDMYSEEALEEIMRDGTLKYSR